MKRILIPLTFVTAAAAGMIATNPAAHVAQAADPDRSIDEIELTITSRAYTAAYLTKDSDGDGWSDWFERLEGTDPDDPTSHPGEVHLDVAHLDGVATVFVQSAAFPDRLVALDGVLLPERVDSVGQLLGLVSQITGQTTLGKFGDELDSSVKELGGDVLAGILAAVSAEHGSVDISMGGRAGGQITALISADGSGVSFSLDGKGLRITTVTDGRDATGTGHVGTVTYLNGERVEIKHQDYKNGVLVFSQTTDATGSVVDANVTPLSDATTVAPTTVKTSTPDTTAAPASTTATTTKGDYTNPDDDSAMWRTPTLAEAEARVKFLGGVRARYGGVLEIPSEIPKDAPGVHDPAEPECDQAGCVAFTEIVSPDLTRTSGGCPPTYCTPGRP